MPDDGGGEEGEQAGDVLAIEDKTEKSAERYDWQNYYIPCIKNLKNMYLSNFHKWFVILVHLEEQQI